MNEEKRSRSVTTDGRPPAPGLENASAPGPIGPNGQHTAYWILSEEERAKGFVRPVRDRYRHTGLGAPAELRDLTPEEQERYQSYGYIKFQPYPASESPLTGRFWTQADLDKIDGGCGTVTRMGSSLSETWARDPTFYGTTFCAGCGVHLPIAEFRWETDGAVLGT